MMQTEERIVFKLTPTEYKPEHRRNRSKESELRYLTKTRCYVELKLLKSLPGKQVTKVEISENHKAGVSVLVLFEDGSYIYL